MSLFADNHFEESGKGLVVTSNIKGPSKIQQIKSDKVLTGKIYTTEWIVNLFSTKFIKHFPGNELQFRSVPCKYKYALIEKKYEFDFNVNCSQSRLSHFQILW